MTYCCVDRREDVFSRSTQWLQLESVTSKKKKRGGRGEKTDAANVVDSPLPVIGGWLREVLKVRLKENVKEGDFM